MIEDQTEYGLQEKLLNEQRARYAQQAAQGIPQGQYVGNRFVRPSTMEVLASAIRNAGGLLGQSQSANALKELRGQRNQAQTQDMSKFVDLLRGSPGRESVQGSDSSVLPEYQDAKPATAGSPTDAYAMALRSQSPQLQQVGLKGMEGMPALEMQKQEHQANRESRAEDKRNVIAATEKRDQETREFKREQALRDHENRLDIVKIQAALRPERNVTILGPNGEPITVPQSQSAGMPMYSPAVAKNLQQQKTKQEAKEQLSSAVGDLKSNYDILKEGGGITSTQRGALGNLGAAASASGIGQLVGGAVGAENQSARQKIEQTRPLLLNFIKNATGMSAQQMNSNAEMQLYLKAATDPKLGYEANMNALRNLDKTFGLGNVFTENTGATKAPSIKPLSPGGVKFLGFE
tara:strand:+ start:251 stop:1468 length:1218 start_codon:yes stop_codon:yes gene_type:complete